MTRAQAFMLLILGYLLVTAGLTWSHGPLVLCIAGAVLCVSALVLNLKE